MSIATLLLPDFLLIVLGHVLLRVTRWEASFWAGLEKLVYYLLFPALLFYASVRAPLDLGASARLLEVALAVCLAGIALGWLAKPLLRPEPGNFASGVQTAFRFNSYIALAAAQRLAGESGTALMAILIGFCVPLCNLAAVAALAPKGRGLLRELARNPLLLATTAGITCNLLGITLPELLELTLARLGNTSIALGLMLIGVGLRFEGLRGTHGLALYFMAIKLLALPALALALGHWWRLPPEQWQIAVLFAALPTSTGAYVLTSRMGGNAALVAFAVSASTLASMLTVPFWLGWLPALP